ncbi:phospholipase D-like domain-containing protein [Rhizobium leguminosarum]|uniref:phospholipase D-like domain-containing protein n=1 Tax=Rhizobium leguminosarum TaxID=384 RepID=UPI001C928807|nr:phospholipase D-like domain-containing protein [Rhizobium leguminosarum]MBY2986681.1 hypothetical protein [Rhizobium leguminosarum]
MHTRTYSFIAFVFYFAMSSLLARADTRFELIPTEPSCKQYEYQIAVPSPNGDLHKGPVRPFFCTRDDFPESDDLAVLRRLDAAVADRQIKDIRVSAYYYSDVRVARFICSRRFTADAKVTVYRQAGRRAHVSEPFMSELANCKVSVRFLDIGCDVFAADSVCRSGSVNVLHSKVMLIRGETNWAVTVLSSGNFNKSMFANIEDWVVAVTDVGSKHERQVACIFSTLEELGGVPAIPQGYASGLYSRCIGSWNAGGADNGVELLMMPSGEKFYIDQMVGDIEKASEVIIVSQYLSHDRILNAISKTGASVRVLSDSAWHFVLQSGAPVGVFNVADTSALAVIQQKRTVDQAFLMTNYRGDGGLCNTVHARFVVIRSTSGTTVYTGSAHLRTGSFQLNLEQQMRIQNPELAESYVKFAERLTLAARTSAQLPSTGIAIKATELNSCIEQEE